MNYQRPRPALVCTLQQLIRLYRVWKNKILLIESRNGGYVARARITGRMEYHSRKKRLKETYWISFLFNSFVHVYTISFLNSLSCARDGKTLWTKFETEGQTFWKLNTPQIFSRPDHLNRLLMPSHVFGLSFSSFHDTIAWFITKHLHGDRLDNPSSFNTALVSYLEGNRTPSRGESFAWRHVYYSVYTLYWMIHLKQRKREKHTKNGRTLSVPNFLAFVHMLNK
jgi:hypothetical protein